MSSFSNILKQAWEQNTLFSVLLELTYSCNLSCSFCYNDLALKGRPLSTRQWLDLLSDLASMGAMQLTLTGGEPLAHPDFFQIGGEARRLGFMVRVKSNGHALDAPRAERLIREVNPFVVELSLHGDRATTHDRQTGIPGSFGRLMTNLEGLLARGQRLRLNSTLTRWNEGEIEGMFALADGFGVPLIFDPEVSPRDDGDRTPLSLTASREGLKRLFAIEKQRHERSVATTAPSPGKASPQSPSGAGQALVRIGGGQTRQGSTDAATNASSAPTATPKHCGAGSSGLAIDPHGNVYPCVQWRRAAGNLHEESIAQIWASSPVLAGVRRLGPKVTEAVAAVGPKASLMGFCPGSAEAATGDPLRIYPGARRRLALHTNDEHQEPEVSPPPLQEQPSRDRGSPLPIVG